MKSYTHILKTGSKFIIDEDDKFILDDYILNIFKPKLSYTYYVCCKNKITRKYSGLLHRIILNVKDKRIVDHINGDGLDCRKGNLRISNGSLNQQNRRLTKDRIHHKGIFYRKDRGYWTARLQLNNKVILLGSFMKLEDAIKARLEAEKIYYPHAGLGTNETELNPEIMGTEF